MEKDEFFIKRIRELANLSYQRDIVTFSDFLNLNEQNIINDRKNQMPGVVVECFGGYEQAERQMAAFHPDALLFPWKYPICCLKVEPLAAKFSEELTHRDFLGALMHLGIDRSTLGDIRLSDGKAYLFCLAKVSDYIVENLTKIRHTVVRCRILDEIPEQSKPQVTEETLIVSSLRLDGIVAKLYHLSRSQSLLLFREKKVYVDGRCMENNSGICKEGSIVSVRGYGRFVYQGLVHETKKGNLSIQIGRYGGVH